MNASVAPGDVLAGKYRVERVLGKGGMGVVVAALHQDLGRQVALKFLLPEVAQNPELVARFSREAQAASRIQSEHVAKVLDVGKLDDGVPFMVMEYLDGSDLAQLVKSRGALAWPEAIAYVLQACEALAEAHVAGIVHRDLKPANLFLTRRADGSPCIKVLDFGISKIALASDQGQGMTQTSALMGSPNYMSPEQLRSARSVDARTDIWSLGIILQELITGDVAFKAETVPELYVSILQSAPIPLRSRRPDAPPAMEAIVSRCLEKDPARRFANVGELASALAELAPPGARLSIERITRIVGSTSRPPSVAPPGPGIAPTVSGPAPTYVPGPPASTYASQAGGAPPAPHYAPPMPYGPPMPMPAPPLGYGPGATAYPQQQGQGMQPATIALLILVALIVLGGGGCMMCICIGAANSGAQHPGPEGAGGLIPAGPHVATEAAPGAFQRPAGWTTVSPSAKSRVASVPCSSSTDVEPGRPITKVRKRRGRAQLRPKGARQRCDTGTKR